MQKFYIILIGVVGLIFLLVILMLYGIIPGMKPNVAKKVNLEFWGFDDPDIYAGLLAKFQKEYNIEITYKQKSQASYEDELLDAMAGRGRGPDIFMIHNSWLPRHENKLTPFPSDPATKEKWEKDILGEETTLEELKSNFVDVVIDDFVKDAKLYAVPLYVDTLALYYNKDIFNTVGIPTPPKTWEEFTEMVKRITVVDGEGDIVRAGTAMGTGQNILHSTDILALIMLQKGNPIISEGSTVLAKGGEGIEALNFYTSFADSNKAVYTWNYDMPNSLDAFLKGNLAMMFGYSEVASPVKKEAPYLNFRISPMPQLEEDGLERINHADYWGLAVSCHSKNPKEAWWFILWMAGEDNAKTHLSLSQKPTSMQSLVSWQRSQDPELGVFSEQSLSAKSWPQPNKELIGEIFVDMIESVIGKEIIMTPISSKEAINRATDQINALLK